MSLILEALRKSEAERQRGRAPGLFVEQSLVRSRRRSTLPWPWLLVAALGLALLGWFAWRWTHPAPGAAEPETALATAPPAVGPPAPAPVPGRDAAPGDPHFNPGAASPGDAEAMQTPEDRTPPPVRPRLMDTAVPQVANVADPVDVDRSVRAPPAQVELPPQPEPPPQPMPTTMPEAPPAAVQEALPSLAALPAADRTQLPPLKLSMHVFAEDPAQRFVILDGKRLAEGASPAPGVVVEQVRRDGVVLSVNGQRVLLSRP